MRSYGAKPILLALVTAACGPTGPESEVDSSSPKCVTDPPILDQWDASIWPQVRPGSVNSYTPSDVRSLLIDNTFEDVGESDGKEFDFSFRFEDARNLQQIRREIQNSRQGAGFSCLSSARFDIDIEAEIRVEGTLVRLQSDSASFEREGGVIWTSMDVYESDVLGPIFVGLGVPGNDNIEYEVTIPSLSFNRSNILWVD